MAADSAPLNRRRFLQGTLALLTASAQAVARAADTVEWIDSQQIGPFAMRSTYPLGGDAQLAAALPELEAELRRVLGLSACRQTVAIYLFADRRQHERWLAAQFPAVPYRRALFVQQGQSLSVFAYRDAELATDLRHETTHALLHADLPMVPLWLDEGLAEYFEMPRSDRALRNPHLDELVWPLRTGRVSTLERLQRKHELDQLDGADYRDAWAWVHFMLHGPVAAHAELVRYLADIRQRSPPGDFAERLARVVPNPQQQMHDHFRHWLQLAQQQRSQNR